MVDFVNAIDRIGEFEAYCIMDTAAEVRYDDITELVSKIFEMPLAIITPLSKPIIQLFLRLKALN